MRRSASIQDASDAHPRAIVFGDDARFIFTFNGEPSQRGYDAVEILQFRERTDELPARWELREIRFRDGKSPELSEANPGRCVQCHGAEPQPLWEQYDFWPGAYGEEDDAIRDFDEKFARRGSDSDERVARGRRELTAYRAFLAAKDAHPRYRKLSFPEGSPVTPYNKQVRSDYRFRPNLRFTDAVTRLHAKVVADRLEARPGFDRLGPALVEGMMGCVPWTDGTALAAARAGVERRQNPFAVARWSRFGDRELYTELVKAMQLLAVGPRQFSTAPSTAYYGYFEGESQLSELVAGELYDRLLGADDEPVRYADLKAERDADYYEKSARFGEEEAEKPREGASARERLCANLARHRERALTRPLVLPRVSVPPTVTACLRCHDGHEAPAWPLADRENAPERWERWLADVRRRIFVRPKGRAMPPDRRLDAGEVAELLGYLRDGRP
jgi:hypothetical protein